MKTFSFYNNCLKIEKQKAVLITYDANIHFIGAGIGEESLRDAEDRVLGSRLDALPPGGHGPSSGNGSGTGEDPGGDRRPNRHGEGEGAQRYLLPS